MFKYSLLLLAFVLEAHAAVVIEDASYRVSVNPGEGGFMLAARPSGKVFLAAGRLSGTGGTARVVDAAAGAFGPGRAIEVLYPGGDRETIALHPGLPFVLFGGSRHNGGADPLVLNKVPAVSGAVELGKPLSALRTLGTAGLLEPAANPGSYAFLAIADPETRRGVIGGWVTHDRGSGVVFSPVKDGKARIGAQVDYGRLRIGPGMDAALETFAVGYFEDARFGLEAYADAIATYYSIRLPPHRPGFCTWYMEKHGGACDEKSLMELAEYAARNLRPFGFDFVQIDDGWQEGITDNGPAKNFTAHRPTGPYPSGMKVVAGKLKGLGLTPGIWFMPFAGNHRDPYFQPHPDWFVKDPQGRPYETDWGGTCLDMTHPAARAHLKGIVERIAGEWGYRLFKLDGFWTGGATRQVYVNDGYNAKDRIGDAGFHDPDRTNIEALREGARLVRAAAGPDVFLLGCCVSQNMRSFGGSFGLLDAMRVGPDTGAGQIGAPHASRLWFLNGRVWWNDPDCVSVRAGYPLEQARLNATFTAIAGDLFYSSDWMPDFPPERLDILRRSIPAHGLPARPVDVFERHPARIWHIADTRGDRRDVVALYNWEKAPAAIECAAGRIGLPPAEEYVAFDFWSGRFVPPFRDVLRAELPAGPSCRVLAVRPVSPHPQILSTSRHVTQGMVDLSEERWDAAVRTLSAESRAVAGDPYEIRIVVPAGENSWRIRDVRVSEDDRAAGVKAAFRQGGPKIRIVFDSPASRGVKWGAAFEAGRVEAEAVGPVKNLRAVAEYGRVRLSWDDDGAESYRVSRDDGVAWATSAPRFDDESAPRGKTLRYAVAAVGWDGSASEESAVEVTAMAELKAPPKPPLPAVYLDDLSPRFVANGWGRAAAGKSVSGGPLEVEGRRYSKGLGVHAPSTVTCSVPAGVARFVAVVGIDDSQRRDERASIAFEVYGAAGETGEGPVLLGRSPLLSSRTIRSWTFDIEIDGQFRVLRLVVGDGGDGIACDHGDWVDAGFTVK